MNFLFIKLGAGGVWESECIKESILLLDFSETSHERCLNKEWNEIQSEYVTKDKKDSSTASRWIGEQKYFYEGDEETIWVTFYDSQMWWCRAHKGVELINGKKVRKCFEPGWQNVDLKGLPLTMDTINGRVLKTRGYRGTICHFEKVCDPYLERRIKGEEDEIVTETRLSLSKLENNVCEMIQKLNWQDFEVLVDLFFLRNGWVRDRQLGKTEKLIECSYKSTFTGESIAIQVKSQASAAQFLAWQNDVRNFPFNSKYFFVHTFLGDRPDSSEIREDVELYQTSDIARKVISLGLIDWLMDKLG